MARLNKPLCKICKKNSEKLYLKGSRCQSSKCAVERTQKQKVRVFKRRRKLSEYGVQLQEKNKVKAHYNVMERQFKRYFFLAKKMKGVTGENLLQILERRLDNVIYRANWSFSRRMSRQIITHGQVLINGKRNDRPGYVVKTGDSVSLKVNSNYSELVKASIESNKGTPVPAWIKPEAEKLAFTVLRYPVREEISLPINEQLIINLYSK